MYILTTRSDRTVLRTRVSDQFRLGYRGKPLSKKQFSEKTKEVAETLSGSKYVSHSIKF